ncbi:DUF6461 domain-containing protein [Actinomadura scrupuli]|uniref:DUF6461 domain-containing protein n=1 Tax=Actinomadura scrupuli TaxID=559629 RepID=UPI003D97CF58
MSRFEREVAAMVAAATGLTVEVDHHVYAAGRKMRLDLSIPELNLFIKLDPHRYHSNLNSAIRDQAKMQRLEAAGLDVIRIRQQGLRFGHISARMPAMTASVADYAWVKDSLLRSHLGYCIGLVQQIFPQQVLDRFKADRQGDYDGLAALYSRNDEVQERLDYNWGDFQFVGATQVTGTHGKWTLTVEFNGLAAIDHSLMRHVTTGTTAVSHSINPVAVGRFCSWRDGHLLTWFETPYQGSGEAPEALDEVISRVGVGSHDSRKAEGYFALAEELTGIRLTPYLLDQAVFSTGIVPLTDRAREHGWRWTDPDPDPEELAARDHRIRVWTRSQGMRVPDGPLPPHLIRLYEGHDSEPRKLWFL